MKRIALTLGAVAATSAPALAHFDPVEHGSFAAGFSHPFFGTDHVLAMVAVGLWASMLGGRAILTVPAAFVACMGAGFAASLMALPLPMVEPVILASVIVLGLMAMVSLRVPAAAAAAMVGFFAFFHGHAHGSELGAAGALTFGLGFAASTVLLHAAGIRLGIALGKAGRASSGNFLARLLGAATALGGAWLAVGA